MNPIEIIILILAAIIGLQDICNRIRRPALLNPLYVLIGLLIGDLLTPGADALLQQVGQFGFIMILFLIGLEIEIPSRAHGSKALKLSFWWVVAHIPIVFLLARSSGLAWESAAVSLIALTGCSVSMAFSAWFTFPHTDAESRRMALLWMVALEILSIVQLAAAETLLEGFGWKSIMHMLGMVLAVYLIAKFGDRLFSGVLGKILERTARWKIHAVVLFVLCVSALGNRLGLSAPKTAFFLGMFIGRATHEGLALEHHLKPLAQNLLVPVFFVYLGTLISLDTLWSPVALMALLSAFTLLGFREILYRRFWRNYIPGSPRLFLLVCPNLTLVAVAVQAMSTADLTGPGLEWLLLTGLIHTVTCVFLLPPQTDPENWLHEGGKEDGGGLDEVPTTGELLVSQSRLPKPGEGTQP